MKKYLLIAALFLPAVQPRSHAAEVKPEVTLEAEGSVTVSFHIPPDSKVFAEAVSVKAKSSEGVTSELAPISPPTPELHDDGTAYYTSDTVLLYRLPEPAADTVSVEVGWQACVGDVCLLPQIKTFQLSGIPEVVAVSAEELTEPDSVYPEGLVLTRKLESGADAEKFLQFLAGETLDHEEGNPLERARAKGGFLLMAGLIMFGGLLLNLTPCVLPLIPINLAILGIGTHGSLRKQGFAIGTSFGLGIAISYGALGILSTATGAVFGSLQASPIFNSIIAAVFCVLALAMLGVFTIDFSRIGVRFRRQPSGDTGEKSGASTALRHAGAFAAGAGSALLAGACVAPVLIWTFVMSATLVGEGVKFGAALPLLLGLGMALPWPFLGGGVATLPRPGKWMNIVRYTFAVVFLLFATYYAVLAYRILFKSEKIDVDNGSGIEWIVDDATLGGAYESNGSPVLMYLTSDSCGVCRKMEATTFKDEEVIKATRAFNAYKVNCTDLSDPKVAAILERLGVKGFPFFAIFEAPAQNSAP